MDSDLTNLNPAESEEQPSSETPEDVAILYSWANLHGAKYRDFSASRREYRAQIRHRAAQELREAELKAKAEAEAAAVAAEEAAREAERAASRLDSHDAPEDREHALKVAEENARKAAAERVEAARRAEAAAMAEAAARREEREIAEAHASAQRQAAHYADSEIRRRVLAGPQPVAFIPGQTEDPYVLQQLADGDPFTPIGVLKHREKDHLESPFHDHLHQVERFEHKPERADSKGYSSQPERIDSKSYPSKPERPRRGESGIFSLGLSEIAPRPQQTQAQAPPPSSSSSDGRRRQGYKPDEASGVRPSFRPAAEPVRTEAIRIAPVPRDPAVLEAARNQDSRSYAVAQQQQSQQQSQQPQPVQPPQPATPASPFPQQAFPTQPVPAQPRPGQHYPGQYFPELAGDRGQGRGQYDGPPPSYNEPAPRFEQPVYPDRPSPARYSASSRDDSMERGNAGMRQFHERQAEDRRRYDRQSPDRRGQRPDQRPEQRPEQSLYNQPNYPPASDSDRGYDFNRNSDRPDRSQRPNNERPDNPRLDTQFRGPVQDNLSGMRPSTFSQEYRAAGNRAEESAGPAWLYSNQQQAGYQQTGMRPPAGYGSPSVADTLQYSRERVASRWYALKGVFNHPGQQEPTAAPEPRQREVRTPVLAVFSLAGGVGKTSLVATLGRSLSSLGEKVLLADTTTQTLLPYYFGASELRPGVVRTFSPPSGSTDAPIHMVSYDLDQVGSERQKQDSFTEQLMEGAHGVQRVLLDLNGQSGWVVRRLVRMNATILVPVAPDMNSVISLQAVERYFNGVTDHEGRAVQPYFMLNQFDPSLPLHLDVREVLRQQLGDRLLPFVVRRSPAVSEALAEGMTVVDYAPEGPIAEDYLNVANWLRGIAAPASSGFRTIRWSEQ